LYSVISDDADVIKTEECEDNKNHTRDEFKEIDVESLDD
jgi:hypothetical protein